LARRRYGACLVALAGMAVGACSPLGALDTLVPDDSYRLDAHIPYGDHPRQRLDVYRPLNAGEASPVAVFFYGGSWKAGKRGQYRFVGEALARRGITTVVPDYWLYPEIRFPAFL
jgi:acetyl esterase/lipase